MLPHPKINRRRLAISSRPYFGSQRFGTHSKSKQNELLVPSLAPCLCHENIHHDYMYLPWSLYILLLLFSKRPPRHCDAPLPLFKMLTTNPPMAVSNMLNRLHGQPESYDKKYVHRVALVSTTDMSNNCA